MSRRPLRGNRIEIAEPGGDQDIRRVMAELRAAGGPDLNAVPWSRFHHAYGPADDVPQFHSRGPRAGEVLEWLASAAFSRGVPDHVPDSGSAPSVGEVLSAFGAAGCHGTAWFSLSGKGPDALLDECEEPRSCRGAGGLDLGEVSLRVAGQLDGNQMLEPDAPVEAMSFRKPVSAGVLALMCELARNAGPQLVFDDSADSVFVVRPGEHIEDLLADWPW